MTSQKYPSVTWQTGIRHEALRLIYYLKRLPEQELQQRGFLVLPFLPSKNNHITILIPNLDFSVIKNLWYQTSHLNPTTPMTAPESLITAVTNLLTPTYTPPPTEFVHLPPLFFKTIFDVLPEYKSSLSKINLIVTHCGTNTQFNIITPQQSALTIYLRPDTDVGSLCRIIILALIRHQLQYFENRTWEEIMAVADYLINHTIIKNLFKPSELLSMMSLLQQKQTGPLYRQSLEYQTRLGIPVENNWQIKNDQIFYQTTPITQLTSRQYQLLKLLITSYGQTVKLDQIADTLWPNGEDYSLWAIVKEVARIRQRIVQLGLPGSLIKSHRKVGYQIA